jgi:hypothetical protein
MGHRLADKELVKFEPFLSKNLVLLFLFEAL